MIQFGTAPGTIAYVIVPAVPLAVPAAGIAPMEPGCVTSPGVVVVVLEPLPLLLVLLQAARAVTLATARARRPMCFFPNLVLAPFLALLAPSVGTGIISLPSFSRGSPVIHCAPAAGHWVAIPPIPVRPSPRHNPRRPVVARAAPVG